MPDRLTAPAFPTSRFDEAGAALARVREIYAANQAFLRQAGLTEAALVRELSKVLGSAELRQRRLERAGSDPRP